MIINFKKLFILLILLILGFAEVNSAGTYKNELTKVSLSPIGSSDVKVTLYMAKPYSEPLRLLKKNDGEFVLILPETYNSAPQKPSISDVIGEVTDADIKLYSFVSNANQNGYTKIVIKTNGLVNLYPEAVTTGGGSMTNHPQAQINKIINEQLRPTMQQQEVAKVDSKKVKEPVAVVEVPILKKTVEQKQVVVKTQAAKKEEVKPTKKEELKKVDVNKEQPKKIEETVAVAKTEEILAENEVVPPQIEQKPEVVANSEIKAENEVAKITLKQKIKKTISIIPTFVQRHLSGGEKAKTQFGNIFITLFSIMLFVFSLKFAIAVIKNSGQKPEDNKNTDEKSEYSNFFKNIIENETKIDDKKFKNILSQKKYYTDGEVTLSKSHKEIMNEDQNLSWQEKFRELQRNKKALLKEQDKDIFDKDTVLSSENTENMNIENPIKKLKQDFRAVKKVLEKQAKNRDKNSIKQDFTPEKIDKIEVISFEDLQKRVQQPKVQINKTVPIKQKAPKILTRLKLSDNKGFYLVDYKEKISLLGYVNDKVFKLNSYMNVKSPKLYARITEQNPDKDTYIIKLDSSKLLVDVNNEEMKLKLIY